MDRDRLALQVRDTLEKVHPHPLDSGVIVARANRRRRRRLGAMGAAFGLVASAVLAISILGGPSEGPLSPPTVQASARVTLPGAVVGTAVAEGEYLWVLTCSTKCGGPPRERRIAQGALVKIDSRTGAIVATTAVEDPGVVAAGEGGVWTASPSGIVTRFDPRTAKVVGSLRLSLPKPITTATAPEAFAFLPNAIVADGGAVWVSTAREYVAQIDPKTTEVLRMIRAPYMVSGMTVGADSVWLSAGLFGFGRIDAEAGDLEPPQPIEDAEGRRLSVDYLTVADGSLWARGGWSTPHGDDYVLSPKGKALGLARVDLHTAELEQLVSFDGFIWVHAVSGPYLWLSSRDSRAGSRDVYVLSRGAGEVTLAARLAKPGTIVGAVGTSLWVARPGQVLERYEIPVRDGR